MKLIRLLLQSFGPFTGTVLDLAASPANLHLLYGPNEAGKSSALRAMTDLRFGIPLRSPDDFLHPSNQLSIAGVFLDAHDEPIGLVRHKGRGSTLLRLDVATEQLDASLPVLREHELALTGGLERKEFEAMFGLNHARLREGGDLLLRGEGELGSALFEASAGTRGIAALLAALDVDAKQIYNPHGRAQNATINEARRQLDEQRHTWKQAQTRPADWQNLNRAHETAKTALTDVSQILDTLRRRENELTELRTVEPLIRAYDRTLVEFQALVEIPELSESAREERLAAEQSLRRTEQDLQDADRELARELDRQALELYLRLHHIPAPATIYQGVHKLPPASRLTISCSHGVGKVERWWRPHFAPLAERSAAQWAEEALSALDESVKSHLVADVPFGAFLSGGLDSAAVVAAMAAAGVRPLRTFTIGFAEAAFDERPAAAATAARWGAEHHHEEVRPDALALLPALVRHFGEPFGDSSAVPAWYAARLARRQVPMVLSGDGGDELFAGYDHHRDWLAWLRPGPLRRLAGVLAPGAYPPPRADLPGWLHRHAATTARERAQLWRTELRPPTEEVPAAFADALAGGAPAHPLSLAQSLDLQVYLPGDLLTKVDTTAMMHGLEVRTPFADVRLAEFAATIPPTLQAGVVDGHWQGKLVLRQALRGRYPPALLSGRKRGFAVPLAQWFAPGGPLHPALAERLLDARSPLGALFSPAGLQALVRARRAGPLWLLLVLDEWLRQQPGVAL